VAAQWQRREDGAPGRRREGWCRIECRRAGRESNPTRACASRFGPGETRRRRPIRARGDVDGACLPPSPNPGCASRSSAPSPRRPQLPLLRVASQKRKACRSSSFSQCRSSTSGGAPAHCATAAPPRQRGNQLPRSCAKNARWGWESPLGDSIF
jgi:hypothetical protein